MFYHGKITELRSLRDSDKAVTRVSIFFLYSFIYYIANIDSYLFPAKIISSGDLSKKI